MIKLALARKVIGTSPEQDDLLNFRINSVIADFNTRTSIQWSSQTAVEKTLEVLRPEDTQFLNFPNVTVTEVLGWDSLDSTVVLAESDDAGTNQFRTLQKTVGTFWLIPEVSWDYDWLKVTFNSGYTELPASLADITQAILEQVKFLEQRYSGENAILDSKSVGDSNASFIRGSMHPLYRDAVKKYRLKTP